jgi:hypothetical protein
MISLLCKKCGKHWYTANTQFVPECDDCGGELIEDAQNLLSFNKAQSIKCGGTESKEQ